MKKKIKIGVFICALVIALLATIYKEWLPPIMSHIIHKNPLVFMNISINVPLDWVIMTNKNNHVSLTHKSTHLRLQINNKIDNLLNKESVLISDLPSINEKLKKFNMEIVKIGEINLANKKGVYFDVLMKLGQGNRWKVLKIITLRSENIQIELMSTKQILGGDLEILKNISFRSE